MYTSQEYSDLTSKYGPYASWAIWNYSNSSDTEIIDQNFHQLHSKFVLLGLNISRTLKYKWSNFHDNSHARKLKYACNDTKLRGSYMTDLFKDVVMPKSSDFKKILTDKIISENIDFFKQEMENIKITDNTQFIIFGTLASQYFNDYFKKNYKNRILQYRHYSDFSITDKEWVTGFWDKLNIDQNFDLTIRKYE